MHFTTFGTEQAAYHYKKVNRIRKCVIAYSIYWDCFILVRTGKGSK